MRGEDTARHLLSTAAGSTSSADCRRFRLRPDCGEEYMACEIASFTVQICVIGWWEDNKITPDCRTNRAIGVWSTPWIFHTRVVPVFSTFT